MATLVGIISLAAVGTNEEECHLPVKTLLEAPRCIKQKKVVGYGPGDGVHLEPPAGLMTPIGFDFVANQE